MLLGRGIVITKPLGVRASQLMHAPHTTCVGCTVQCLRLLARMFS